MADGEAVEGGQAATVVALGDNSMRLTRSATMFQALLRIYGGRAENVPASLALHIVGADHREGNTPQESREVFENLLNHLNYSCDRTTALHLLLCGPNVAAAQDGKKYTFRYQAIPNRCTVQCTNNDDENESCPSHERTQSAMRASKSPPPDNPNGDLHQGLQFSLQYDVGLYHKVSRDLGPAPNVLFLFNAGLWGYDDWTPTLECIMTNHADSMEWPLQLECSLLAAVVVTSYCAEEAEDDMDTIERLSFKRTSGSDVEHDSAGAHSCGGAVEQGGGENSSGITWLWRPEINPHRSFVARASACAVEGRELFENHSWQAFRPRGRRRKQSD